jgi:hypothetical protein
MGNSTLPTVLDKLVMVGNINIRKHIRQVSDQIKLRGFKLENLAETIRLLEESMNRLDG